jgi:hypothetical protein
MAIPVDEAIRDPQVLDQFFRVVDRFTHDDHRAIGSGHEAQNGGFTHAAQRLIVAIHDEGPGDFKNSGGQANFTPAAGQYIQGLLDLGLRNRGRQRN